MLSSEQASMFENVPGQLPLVLIRVRVVVFVVVVIGYHVVGKRVEIVQVVILRVVVCVDRHV